MLPKSRFLFKKTVFIKVAAFLVLIPTIVVLTFTQKQPVADAQIAFLYASTCLGGWKGVDKITGVPEVAGDASATYSEENSATLHNTQTQVYCGGFTGAIPDGVDRTHVTLRFSWGIEGKSSIPAEKAAREEVDSPITNPTDTNVPLNENASSEPSLGDTVPINRPAVEDLVPEGNSTADEPPIEGESTPVDVTPTDGAVSWLRYVIPIANAQEEGAEPTETVAPVEVGPIESIEEIIVEDIVPTEPIEADDQATSSPISIDASSTSLTTPPTTDVATATNTPGTTTSSLRSRLLSLVDTTDKDNAIFEVLFTMDNETWYPLGYVPRINNDIAFELPIELFTTVDDFSKLQISLKTLERFDDTPKIFLDSMWIEVSYVPADQDPLSPPGTLPGDVILQKTSTEEVDLVTLFRNVELATLSNIFSLASGTVPTGTSTTIEDSTATGSTSSIIATSTPSSAFIPVPADMFSASSTIVAYSAGMSEEVKRLLRSTPGIVLELWLYNRRTDSWARVADNEIIATDPKVTFFDNKVFWFSTDLASLWMFDSLSGGYSSRSFTPGEPIQIEFIHSSNESYVVEFDTVRQVLVPQRSEATPLSD